MMETLQRSQAFQHCAGDASRLQHLYLACSWQMKRIQCLIRCAGCAALMYHLRQRSLMTSACCLMVRPDLLPCKRSLTLPFPHNLESDGEIDDVGIPRWRSISGDAVNAFARQPLSHLQC